MFARWGKSDWWRFLKKMGIYILASRPVQGVGYWAALLSLLLGLFILTTALLRGQDIEERIRSRIAVAETEIRQLKEIQKDATMQRHEILAKIANVDQRLREIEWLVRALLWVVGTLILPLLIACLRWLAGFYGALHRERYAPGGRTLGLDDKKHV